MNRVLRLTYILLIKRIVFDNGLDSKVCESDELVAKICLMD